MACEPSVLPLSAMMISPRTPARWRPSRAFSMQRASVSASFRQGMTMLSSTGSATGGFYSNAPVFGERGFLSQRSALISGPARFNSTLAVRRPAQSENGVPRAKSRQYPALIPLEIHLDKISRH